MAISHFASAGSLSNLDLSQARRAYEEAFEQGKDYVSKLDEEKEAAADVFKSLEKLGKLREQGILTEEEFQAKKKELLSRL
ncbi:MAG: SHOCT domain-containing protein [Thermostichus sp. DG02_5_bins_236]